MLTAVEILESTKKVEREACHMALQPVPHAACVDRDAKDPYRQAESPEMYAHLLQLELDIYKGTDNIARRISRLALIAATAVVAMGWETREFNRQLRERFK